MEMKSTHVDYFWEDVCQQQVKDIYDHYYQWYSDIHQLEGIFPIEQINTMMEYLIDATAGLTKPITDEIISGLDDNPIFFDIAGYAIYVLDSTNECPYIDWFYITDILIRKQKDYGPENIMKFGVVGIIVRLFDKVARLNNLLLKTHGDVAEAIKSNSVQGESLIDTLIDIVGYCSIALMITEGDPHYGNKFLVPMSGGAKK